MNSFTETQRFRQIWVWVVLAVAVFFVVVPMAFTNNWSDGWPGVVILVLVSALFYCMRLDTRLDEQGIHFRFLPFLTWRHIHWEDIRSIEVRQYSALAEFGGWGVRFGMSGWAYNISGNWGLQVVRKNGRKILVGTQKPEEAKAVLGGFHKHSE